MTTLAELYAAANQRNLLARRNEPLDVPFDPAHQIPQGMTPPLRMGDVANIAMQNAPGLGDVASLIESYKAWKAGDTTGGLLSGMAALPMVGAIKVYHGSPHKFDRFDMSKIGTGEGAQAYGHGLYFAESPDVAKQYADVGARNSPFDAAYGGVGYDIHPTGYGTYAVARYNNRTQPYSTGRAREASYLDDEFDSVDDALSFLKESGRIDENALVSKPDESGLVKTFNRAPNIYETSLEWPDPAREAADPLGPQHFLDWDRPLSEQKEIVDRIARSGSKILKNTINSMGDLSQSRELYGTDLGLRTGADLMRLLSYNMEGKPTGAKASSAVGKTGIPGIRYLDAGSRGAGDGTYNYVVFDDQIPRIVDRK